MVTEPAEATLDRTRAWHSATACRVTSLGGAHVLRWEVFTPGMTGPLGVAIGHASTDLKLEHPIALDPSVAYLMRCDRVDFAPGGEARPHGHRGSGIRRLLTGELEVRIGQGRGRLMKPGDAWFESGVEPVHALASGREPTSFIRVSILPRELRGRSSIVYVDPADASVKARQYTVYVDEPIELGRAP
jgi:quercetin dioxygenase-like cupin family protein